MARGSRMLVLVALALGAGALPAGEGPSSALAAAPGAMKLDACEPRYVPGLGAGCLVQNGLFRLDLRDGTVLYTHGLDPIPAAAEVGFGPNDEQAPPLCAQAPHIRVLYGFPTGGADRTSSVVEEIRAAVRRMNAVLNADALETGDVRASYRLDCDATGAMTVSTFTGPATGGAHTTDFDAIVEAARAAGFSKPATNYLIFYDGGSPSACGVGNLQQDDRLAADNRNLAGPNYGVVFESCWSGRTPMHENGHNMGAVQMLAPMSDLLGHCLEGYDVMCYTSEIVKLCADRVHFDCGHDTYFHAKPADGSWLATHWNIGSRLNGYLAFSDAPPPSAAPPSESGSPSTAKPDEPPQGEQGNQTTKSESNETAPADQPRQDPANDNGTIVPQAATLDVEGPAVPEPDRAAVPGPLPAALLLALALAAVTRRRPPS